MELAMPGRCAGSKVPVSFTLKYAAPETVQAFLRGRETVVADTAVDVFAFGIMCFELLTRRQYYPKEVSGQEVGEMLSGSRRLPHESMDDATARRLGVLGSCALPAVVCVVLVHARPAPSHALPAFRGHCLSNPRTRSRGCARHACRGGGMSRSSTLHDTCSHWQHACLCGGREGLPRRSMEVPSQRCVCVCRIVLKMLDRSPDMRTSISDLLRTCSRMFQTGEHTIGV